MTDYAYYKSIGICPDCGKREAEPGKVHCKICAEQRNANAKTHRERFNKAWQDFNSHRRENHLCRVCGKPTGGAVYCADCVKIRKIRRFIIKTRKKNGTWTGKIWDKPTQEKICLGILEKWGAI